MKEYDYSILSKHYDIVEANLSIEKFNKVLDRLLKKYKVKSVLDLTCGTGAQSIYLHKKGYKVTAADFSKSMIEIAQRKYPKLKFHQADMRSAKFGKFDSVISIFNAIGHLSKKDFEKSVRNICKNLNKGGIYVFDIFNLDFMKKNFIYYEFIDVAKEVKDTTYVRFNKNKLDKKNRIMTINQKTYIQEGINKPEIIKDRWKMQIYTSDQLKKLLEKNGFEIVEFLNMSGNKFEKENSSFVLTVARKR